MGYSGMKITFSVGGKNYKAMLDKPLHISVPVRFEGERLSVFGAEQAERKPYKKKKFVGSVAKGGSCNCEVYTINPHCNGTHTECVGHITKEPVSLHEILKDTIIPAALVTVTTESAEGCGENYGAEMRPDDQIITKTRLEAMSIEREIRALIIRTYPNGREKITRDYDAGPMPPYFTLEAMDYIATSGFRHLLFDMPSIDRLDDGGALANHRIFWGIEGASAGANPSPKTITELVYVPDEIRDGLYLLNLQTAPFMADAAPSRPVLYEAKKA